MLGSFPPELVVVLQQPVYSGRRSRRCHVINLQIGSSAGLQTRTRTLAAGTPPVQPVRRPAVLIRADPRFWPTLFGMSRRIWIVAFAACVLGFVGAPLRAQWQILNSGTTADLRGHRQRGRRRGVGERDEWDRAANRRWRIFVAAMHCSSRSREAGFSRHSGVRCEYGNCDVERDGRSVAAV